MRRMLTAAAGLAMIGAAIVVAPTASAAPGIPDLSLSITRNSCDITVTNVGGATATGVSLYSLTFGRLSTFPTTLAAGQSSTYHILDCPPGSPYPNAFLTTSGNGDLNPFNNVGVLI
ncbi:hypothetical protein [uncultured Williamsia sp.]|uniref:hypothetical protein n=1 Tax=uncultured Williamsia sp. TaxID=259311 RepID=UPI00262947B6|nr:hypothetical protein [uncultured Williamsia sp.]